MQDYKNKINAIMEAPLAKELDDKVLSLIKQLQDLRSYDFGRLGKGVHTHSPLHIDQIIWNVENSIHNLKSHGRDQEEQARYEESLQAAERKRLKQERKQQKFRSIITQFAEQFPRQIAALTDKFLFVQPNGRTVEIGYNIATESFISLIYAFRQLYNMGAYEETEKRVQQVRDYGFNISSKILSTEYSSFRTRYAKIHSVVMSYSGPMVVTDSGVLAGRFMDTTRPFLILRHYTNPEEFTVSNINVPGHCEIDIINRQGYKYNREIENIQLDHLGEIIDTIDTVVAAIIGGEDGNENLAQISEIQCMGDNVVDYILELKNGSDLTVPSSSITNPQQIIRSIYDKMRQERKK